MKHKTLSYTLPACWASYLINGDDSGMSYPDKTQCATFLAREGLSLSGFVDCGESYFAAHNDSGNMLAGDVCQFMYHARARRAVITDTQRLEFILSEGLLVQAVTTSRFAYQPTSPFNPTRADIDKALMQIRRA